MAKCNGCGEEMTEVDLNKIDEIEDQAGITLSGYDYCCIDCRDGFALFIGDYSLLHPDETDEEYYDHEG